MKFNNAIKLLLFDLDGTLLDTALDLIYSINLLREQENQQPIPFEHLRPIVSNGLEELIKAGFNINKDHPNFTRYTKDCFKIYQQNLTTHTKPFPGIIELLQVLEMKNILWGVVTNKQSSLTEPLLEQLGLFKRAACVVSGDTTPKSKPDPLPLLYACQQLAIDPKHSIYVGDAERDIVAGKAAGMGTIGALFGYINNEEEALLWKADHYVHHANEILPWLQIE